MTLINVIIHGLPLDIDTNKVCDNLKAKLKLGGIQTRDCNTLTSTNPHEPGSGLTTIQIVAMGNPAADVVGPYVGRALTEITGSTFEFTASVAE